MIRLLLSVSMRILQEKAKLVALHVHVCAYIVHRHTCMHVYMYSCSRHFFLFTYIYEIYVMCCTYTRTITLANIEAT